MATTADVHEPGSRANRLATALAWLRQYGSVILGAALLLLAIWVIHRALQHITYAQLRQELAAISPWHLTLAIAGTALSFAALAGYEVSALRFIGKPLPWWRASLAAFIAQSISHSTGFATVVGASLRYRIYAQDGLDLGDVARVQLFFSTTFALGILVLAGLALAIDPAIAAAGVHAPPALARGIGLAALLGVLLYLLAGLSERFRSVQLGRHRITLPAAGTTALQLLLAILDLAAAAAALYLLLPDLGVGYPLFVGMFSAAIVVGLLSHVPGALGVFESLLLLMLQPTPAQLPGVIGALVLFRCLYYLLPLLLGAAVLAVLEWRRAASGPLRQTLDQGLKVMAPLAPQLFAMLAFLAGVVLLISGALPGVPARLTALGNHLPGPLIELSHFAGSLVGMGLLLLARSLGRRMAEAWTLTVALLAVGIVVSLLKGFDYEEACLLALVLATLVASRREFYRRASLLNQRMSWGWLLAVGLTLLATVWLITFAYRHVEYANELWWQVELQANAPRAMRATLGAAVLFGAFGLLQLLRTARTRPTLPTAGELAEAEAIIRACGRAGDWLALTGDKAFLFNDARDAFIMYGVSGRSWIAMAQPVGPEAAWSELIWRFHESANRHGARTVFYEVEGPALPDFLELGLAVLKLGETARVDLAEFGLDGRRRANLRHSHNRAARAGVSFEILEPAAVAASMAELTAVSDQWLAEHKTREKRFSLGFFAPGYIAKQPAAVVRMDGRIVAFANLWLAADRSVCSPDLMRFLPDAPKGVMDFLMVEIMLWAKAGGYRWYELGMAPLSGLPAHRLAPLWSKLGRLLYRHGANFYNFEGLRAFKDKFDPVWVPVYLVHPRRSLAQVLADVAALVAGGWVGVVRK